MWCDVMWCDVMWCDVMWRNVMWCDVMWCDVIWCDVMWCDVMWCDVMWCDVMWCDVMWCGWYGWCDVLWCDVMWCERNKRWMQVLWVTTLWVIWVMWETTSQPKTSLIQYHWFCWSRLVARIANSPVSVQNTSVMINSSPEYPRKDSRSTNSVHSDVISWIATSTRGFGSLGIE